MPIISNETSPDFENIDVSGDIQTNTIIELTSGAGVTVEGVLIEDQSIALPASGGGLFSNTITETTASNGVYIEGVRFIDNVMIIPDGSYIEVDTIAEATADNGISMESVLFKDGSVILANGTALATDLIYEKVAGAGVTIDGCLIKDANITLGGGTSYLFRSDRNCVIESGNDTAGGYPGAGAITWGAGSSASSDDLMMESRGALILNSDQGGNGTGQNYAIAFSKNSSIISAILPDGSFNIGVSSSNPTIGLKKGTMYFNSTSNKLRVYNGTGWETVTST